MFDYVLWLYSAHFDKCHSEHIFAHCKKIVYTRKKGKNWDGTLANIYTLETNM